MYTYTQRTQGEGEAKRVQERRRPAFETEGTRRGAGEGPSHIR